MIIKKRLKSTDNQSKVAKQQILEAPVGEALPEKTPVVEEVKEKEKTEQDTLKEFEKIDISEIEFKERIDSGEERSSHGLR